MGSLLVDDLGVWFVGDEPVAKSAGATRMNGKPFLPLISTDTTDLNIAFPRKHRSAYGVIIKVV